MADAGKDGEDKLTECQVFHYLLLMETPYSHLVFVTSIQVHPTLNLHHFFGAPHRHGASIDDLGGNIGSSSVWKQNTLWSVSPVAKSSSQAPLTEA